MPRQKHSRAYHRYFEGYAEREETDAKGRRVISRVYAGQYYKADMPDDVWKRQKLVSAALYALACACFLYAGLTAPASALWYGAILTAGALIGLILLGVSMGHLLLAPREMEIRTKRDLAEGLTRNALLSGLLSAACGLAYAAALVLEPSLVPAGTLPQALACLLAGALCLTLWVLARRTAYLTLPPKHERPAMSSPIRYERPE